MADNSKFVVGDIVRLKSGGPNMTVKSGPGRDADYHCQWFAGKKLEFGHFPFASLEKVNRENET